MTTTQSTAANYQPGDEAWIKFQGMEQTVTIVSGPVRRSNGRRGYDEYEVNLDELDDDCPGHDECSHVIEVAAGELF